MSQYYYPEQFKINDICEKLAKEGNDITVLTGLPNYPDGKILKGYSFFRKRRQLINGVKIIRCYEIPRKSNVVFLALNYISFAISSSLRMLILRNKYDIIYVYQLSPVYSIFTGLMGKIRFKIPMFVYVCDVWPESLKNVIKNEKNIIYKLNKKLSKYLYNKADIIAVTSEPFINHFVNINQVDKSKLLYLPQHAEENLMNIKPPISNGIIDFVFMGNIGLIQDIDCILNAVELLKHRNDFLMHFVGNGSYFDSATQIVKNKGLDDKVIFHGRHDFDKMESFYNFADVCVLTLKSESLVGETLPAKLQGYMAAGRPVVAAISGAAKKVIEDAKCGYVTNAGEYESFAKIIEICIESDSLNEMGQNGRSYFKEHFTLDKHIKILSNKLEEQIKEDFNA